MRLLLDTHVALWAVTLHPRLSPKAADLIADPDNEILVSVASLWEIAIKHAQARRPGDMPMSAKQALESFLAAGYALLGVSAEHALAVGDLPLVHRDPFDRLLVAQSLTEPLRLVTHDRKLAAYSDTVILV
ncbi:MAG: type II toxin-antitoxin system VapC family toxin [Caulobacteraceae bacterium]